MNFDNYRRILHLDLDAFFASVEQRDNPSLQGKAISVGLNSVRGVVASASYEARKFGVRSAMPSSVAARLCPNLIFVPGRMDEYKKASAEVFEIFSRYANLIEQVSIDEAFLDVTDVWRDYGYAMEIAKLIKADVRREVGLIISAGVSYNKFLAKIASDWRKPDGLCVIHPDAALKFIDRLPVKAIWGVGPVTSQKMEALGIFTGKDLREKDLSFLVEQFGSSGLSYYNFARGIDDRPVRTERIRKQVSAEITLSKDEGNLNKLEDTLSELTDYLMTRLRKNDFLGRSLTLKVRFHNFKTITRTQTSNSVFNEKSQILKTAESLLEKIDFNHQTVRLLGIAIGNRLEEDTENMLNLGDMDELTPRLL